MNPEDFDFEACSWVEFLSFVESHLPQKSSYKFSGITWDQESLPYISCIFWCCLVCFDNMAITYLSSSESSISIHLESSKKTIKITLWQPERCWRKHHIDLVYEENSVVKDISVCHRQKRTLTFEGLTWKTKFLEVVCPEFVEPSWVRDYISVPVRFFGEQAVDVVEKDFT